MSFDQHAYHKSLTASLAGHSGKKELFKAAVNAPFTNKLGAARMGLGIVVLLHAQGDVIHRVALSDTELAKGTTTISVKKFEDIKIPLDDPHNIIAKAIRTGKPQSTTDWYYLFTPALTAEEARFNQAGGSIAYSAVYPLGGPECRGAMIFSYYQYQDKMGSLQSGFMEFYSGLVTDRLCNYM